jgi:hypothetical protein
LGSGGYEAEAAVMTGRLVETWRCPAKLVPLMRLRGYALNDDGVFFTDPLSPTVMADLMSIGFSLLHKGARVLAVSERIQ